MPYATNAQLPEPIRKYLPHHAQDIFRAAFNHAYERYGPDNEVRAFRIAWAAVKKCYVQRGAGIWVKRPAHRRGTSMLGRLSTTGLLFAAMLSVGGCSKSESPPPTPAPATSTKPVAKDPAAARKLIAAGAVVLDVRTADEFADAHLPNAVNIPVQELGTRLAEVDKLVAGDKSRPIVVYCAAGSRAAKAKSQLDSAGYTTVVNGGGLDDLR